MVYPVGQEHCNEELIVINGSGQLWQVYRLAVYACPAMESEVEIT